jgi:hypothetical protein
MLTILVGGKRRRISCNLSLHERTPYSPMPSACRIPEATSTTTNCCVEKTFSTREKYVSGFHIHEHGWGQSGTPRAYS